MKVDIVAPGKRLNIFLIKLLMRIKQVEESFINCIMMVIYYKC